MKRVQIVLGALLLSAAVIGFSSFSHKAFASQTIYYQSSDQTESGIGTAASWNTSSLSCDGLNTNICSLTYDDAVYTTVQSALDVVKSSAGTFFDGETFNSGTATITVHVRSNP